MASTPEFNEAQLAAARKALWHQSGAKLVTLDEAREFVERFGLVPFAPGKLGMVAPSLAEATLGEANVEPSLEDLRVARDLAARLTAEGSALPLNLLGGGGDTPDFLVSGAAFKYIYTLRGDKLWKQAPATSGLTPLSLRVFETLTEKGPMTAPELANELGREVTEAAIVRALGELWQTLRVIPSLQQGEGSTMWELTGKRFTKAIKAGVNAGQPTALSALVSMYLAQTMAASEDEIETFLSPLAPRSRVRDVVHALRSARELSEVVVAGKTLLHIAGDVLELPDPVVPALTEEELAAKIAMPPKRFSETETPEPGRITKFEREAGSRAGAEAPKRGAFGRGAPRADRERRPFARRDDGAAKPSFTKPWDEGAKPRRSFTRSAEGGDRPRRPPTPGRSFGGDRPSAPFGDRPKRPYVKREGGEDRPRRPYVKREEGQGGDRPFRPRTPFVKRDGERSGDRPARKPFGARAESFGDRPKRPYVKRDGDDRPKRPYVKREGGDDRPKRPYVKREEGSGGDRPFRPRTPFVKRDGDDRPKRPYVKREGGDDRPKRPYVKREGGEGGARPPRASFGGGFSKPAGGGGAFKRPGRPAGVAKFGKPGGSKFGGAPRGAKPGAPRKPRRGPEE